MMQCCEERGENRPNFTYILSKIEELNTQLLSANKTPPSIIVAQSNESLEPPSQNSTSRRRRSGRNSFSKASPSVMRRSHASGVGSEHLSLTFSVLSDDLSSVSASDDEQGPEGLSPLAESVVYQMLPSLMKDDDGLQDVQSLPTSSPMNLVNSFLDSSTNKSNSELENSSKYAPPSVISPATPSTINTRLTPSESISYTSSQFVRSDESASTPHHSPSPDLTSSMFGEEGNPRLSYLSHADSKASDWTENVEPPSTTTEANGVSDHGTDVVVDMNELNETKTVERSSLGIGLGELSSDLMATFDSWNI